MLISHHTHRKKQHTAKKGIFRNYQLLFLAVLLIFGSILGCCTYKAMSDSVRFEFQDHMHFLLEQRSFSDVSTALLAVFGKTLLLLFVLFLIGMTPYGIPILLGICVCFGFYTGIYNCFVFEANGLLSQLLYVIPTMTLTLSAILTACRCSVHLSCLFSRQLMPFSAHCGSLWQEFKRYLLQYMICIVVAFTAAVCDVMIHLIK